MAERRERVLIDFGAFPGASHVTMSIGANGVTSESNVHAWIAPIATVDHSDTEHAVEPIRVRVTGVGTDVFTLEAYVENVPAGGNINNQTPRAYGLWTVAYEF